MFLLMQDDGVSVEDVQLYKEEAGITVGDHTHIAAFKFNKLAAFTIDRVRNIWPASIGASFTGS
jgi:hypothetical protein